MVKPNEEEIKLINHVEEQVCKYFAVDTNAIVSNNRTSNVTMARGYIFYIIHVDNNLSINKLANVYLRTARAIFWHVNKVKSLIKQRVYKEIYQNICNSL